MTTALHKNKLDFLDGIRGVAALIVVFHHFGLGFFPAINYLDPEKIHLGNGELELLIARTPLNIFFNGGFAVSVFFVLSGFVLSYKFHSSGNRKLLAEYAAKRYFRLLLPVAAVVIICYLLKLVGLFTTHSVENITKSQCWLGGLFDNVGGPLDVVRNIFFDVFFNNDNRFNPVLWTMTIEFLGSLLLFAFLALAGENKKTTAWHMLVVIIILLTGKTYYAAFILGSLLSRLYVNDFSFPKGVGGTVLKGALLLTGIYFSSFPQGLSVQQSMWNVLEWQWLSSYEVFHVLGAFLVMWVVCFDKNSTRFFSIQPFLYLGKISFSFYLLHLPVMASLGCLVFHELWRPGSYFLPFLIAFMVSMTGTLLLSHFFYKWVDRTGILFSDKMGKLITR